MNGTEFNAEKTRDTLVELIRDYTKKAGVGRVVIGISGGKDSSTAAALCARALGPQNVYGIMLPDNVQSDIADSRRICECLGIQAKTVNIGKIHEALKEAGADARLHIAEGKPHHGDPWYHETWVSDMCLDFLDEVLGRK